MRQGPRYLILPAPGPADAVLTGVLLGLALLGFLLVEFETGGYAFTIRNFDEMKWLGLGAAVALGALMFAFGRLEATRPRPGFLDLLLLLLVGWMAVSLAWSPDPARGAMAVPYAGLLLVLYGGVRVLRPERAAALLHGVALTGLAGILALPLMIDDQKLFRGFGNPNFQAEIELVLLAILIASAWRGRRWLRTVTRVMAVVVAVDLFVVTSSFVNFEGSDLQYVALAGIVPVVLFVYGRVWLAAAVVVAGVLVAAAGVWWVLSGDVDTAGGISFSVLTRLQNWTNTVGMALVYPLRGWGAGAYVYGFPDFREFYLDDFRFLGLPAERQQYSQFGEQAHNDLLQTWAEMGLAGVALVVGIAATVLRRTRAMAAGDPAKWIGIGLFALVMASMIGFPFQNPATAAVAAMLLGSVAGSVAGAGGAAPAPAPRRVVAVAAAIAAVFAAGVGGRAAVEAGARLERERAVAHHDAGAYVQSVAAVERALAISRVSPHLRAQLFPEMMIATERGGAGYAPERIEAAYELGTTAAAHNPLLMDFRIKYLAQLPEIGRHCGELDELAATYVRLYGRTLANPHLAEAIVAMRFGDLDRAASALARARRILDGEGGRLQDDAANVTTNRRNLEVLEIAVARSRRLPAAAPACP